MSINQTIINITDEEKERVVASAMTQLKEFDRPIVISTDIQTAVAIIGNLQLALRHPDNRGPSAMIAQEFIINLIDSLDTAKGDVWKFLMLGFHKQHDE